ncbi:MAG: hypothetical protein KME05_02830 [Gloeocapsa sp. UFS-A4-WI-NPMV-4B04]|jgi:hypothetical protein|nr:hypothetical protein [Gloeocapsa sp. UFS-A4-WI-NPMV-4B04]
MRNLHDLGYFERQMLIDRVGRAIAKAPGWQVETNSNILESTNPRLRSYANLASVVIEEIEAYTAEIGEEENDSIN